ncbi:hypothetical protein, partial [Prevotellamassilia timonensis]|uniref:hypothetical protein n=2 Tax=Prevotellamassilia timonensis TaxID=1852370 RepID=UPI00307E85E7
MLTKSVKSVISVVLKHVAQAKKSVQSVRSVSDNISMVSPDSSPCQNGKQVEIITKMIFELCYIEAITLFAPSDRKLYPYDYTMTRKSYANLEWYSKFA